MRVREDHLAFVYPLNALAHVLVREEGELAALHYGLFEHADEPIARAQRRSTDLVRARLPAPPASILDVGFGLGDTLAELVAAGYDARGINPDERQCAAARRRHPGLPGRCERLEDHGGPIADVVVFQESAQYLAPATLWARAAALARSRVLVLDELSLHGEGTLPARDVFLAEAARHGFRAREELDLSRLAAPTVDYFLARFARHREALVRDVGLSEAQVDELVASGERYRDAYARGAYVYRLLDLERW